MTPVEAVLQSDEVFEAFEAAGGQPLTIKKPGHRTLTVIDASAPIPQEEPLSESDITSLKSGIADFENGNYSDAFEFLAEIRREYGLQG